MFIVDVWGVWRKIFGNSIFNTVRTMKNIFRIFALIAAMSVLPACAPKKKAEVPMPPSAVVVAQAKKADFPRYLECLGTMHSFQSAVIVPQVSGQITKINFSQGDTVKEGDVIAQIDPRQYEAAVVQAQGDLMQAEAALKIDQLEVKRNEKLVKDGYVDKQTFDSYVAKVESDKGLMEAAKGRYMQAKLNLEWCTIKAPISGKIGLKEVDVGNIATANSTRITSIEQLDKLYVDFIIPSQRLFEVRGFMEKSGGKLDLEVKYVESNMRDKMQRASVKIVQNKIRYQSGTVILRGEIDNKSMLFWPNQPVKVSLVLETIKGAIIIPYAALETGPNGSKYVYTAEVKEWPVREVAKAPVEIVQINEDASCVVKGVNDGADVVVAGQLAVSASSYALAYSSTVMGMPYGKDGKPVAIESLREFIGGATAIAEKFRAQRAAAKNGNGKGHETAPASAEAKK